MASEWKTILEKRVCLRGFYVYLLVFIYFCKNKPPFFSTWILHHGSAEKNQVQRLPLSWWVFTCNDDDSNILFKAHIFTENWCLSYNWYGNILFHSISFYFVLFHSISFYFIFIHFYSFFISFLFHFTFTITIITIYK